MLDILINVYFIISGYAQKKGGIHIITCIAATEDNSSLHSLSMALSRTATSASSDTAENLSAICKKKKKNLSSICLLCSLLSEIYKEKLASLVESFGTTA